MKHKDEIIEIIKEAFKNVPYPGDDKITTQNCCEECTAIAEILRGKRKEDITREFFCEHECDANGFIPLLKQEAYQYYLPAFLLVLIEYCGEIGDWESYILFSLKPIEPESKFHKDSLKRYEIFTPQQKHAIRLFLEYLIAAFPDYYGEDGMDTPKEALDWYWKNY